MNKDTITWIEVDKELPPAIKEGDFASYSKSVLITDKRLVDFCEYVHFKANTGGDWVGWNIRGWQPTHWAFINLPE